MHKNIYFFVPGKTATNGVLKGLKKDLLCVNEKVYLREYFTK